MSTRSLWLTAIALLVGTGLAVACPDVEVAFDPTQARPGDRVHFFSRLTNTGTEPVLATVEVVITFNDRTFGPFTRQVPLPAGFDRTIELEFLVPPAAVPGTLTVVVTASADNCPPATATAVLEIVNPLVGGENAGEAFGDALVRHGFESPDEPGVVAATWGQVKAQGR